MTTTLYAQPYDISASGFFFSSAQQYDETVKTIKNDLGGQIEEFEIQFIDGELIDCELAKAMGLNQANCKDFLDWVDEWEDYKKINFIIAVGEVGYEFDENIDPDSFDIEIHEEDNLKDLAYRFVDEGLFGDIPDNVQCYLDYDLIARDLGFDYTEITIARNSLIYRCS